MLFTNMASHAQDTIVAIGHSDDDQVHVSNVQEGFQESSFTSDFTQVGLPSHVDLAAAPARPK